MERDGVKGGGAKWGRSLEEVGGSKGGSGAIGKGVGLQAKGRLKGNGWG